MSTESFEVIYESLTEDEQDLALKISEEYSNHMRAIGDKVVIEIVERNTDIDKDTRVKILELLNIARKVNLNIARGTK